MFSVLIVDDEILVRDTLKEYIHWQALGIDSVYLAEDGLEALNFMSVQKPDLVITDIKMPHMDGMKLASQIREQYPDSYLVFLSGYSDKEYLMNAIHLHADGYIEKPLDLDEISDTLRTIVQKHLAKTSASAVNVFDPANSSLPKFQELVKTANEKTVLEAFHSLCNEIRQSKGTSHAYICNLFSSLAVYLESVADFHRAQTTQKECTSFAQTALNMASLQELENEMYRILTLMFEEISSHDTNPVNQVNLYIQKNYANPQISIKQISHDLGFNSSYLCTIYKQHTGKTINSVLTSTRLDAASVLLKETQLKLYEISARVGYPNADYFTQIFTKKNGISPQAFRRLHHDI